MAMSMLPPMVPGFSLRVQLYSPNAHSLSDKPLRCFRVVTSPEATVREFCEEASRIHEINYGEPIAIKKCQDDQEFDITQSEVLGTIFTSAATIRVIQACATPGVRDSVPPTSALRFDPANHLGRKRGREGSPRANGSASSSAWQPNKRQRASDLDPDKPLPSREMDADVRCTIYEEEEPRDEMVPDSQQEATYVGNNGNSRHVRDVVPRISETPSPPPEAPDFVPFKNGSADRQGPKSNAPNTNDPLMSEASIPSPFGPASARGQNAARSKSASYHIQRATERGTSVSTAATSPLSGDLQAPAMNGTRSSNKRKISGLGFEGAKLNGKPNSRSENEDSIYENVPSDSEASAIIRRTKDKLKGKSNSPSGLPGLDWAKDFNTPPTGSRRTSRSQERVTSNGELPLTPNSKEREERKRQKEQAEEARKARVAAAEAAEQRKREADEGRAAEDCERLRKMRDKSEREAREKRNVVIAKAARLEQERLDDMERDRKEETIREAEEKRREQERIREETKQAEHLEREKAQIAKERQEAERVQREKVKAEEVKRAQEDAKRRAKETALAMEEMRKSREQSEQSKASTPDRSRATPVRPQSSTPFIPSGRKSALKAPSSQAAASSSPELIRTVSAGSSNGSKHESERRVSFDLSETPKEPPIRPPILPPSRSSVSKPAPALKAPTLKAPTPKPPVAVTKEPSPKPSTGTSVRSVKQSTTPILPPTIKRSSSTTPLVQSTIVPQRLGATTKPTVSKNTPVTKSISTAAGSVSKNREISNGSTKSKEPTKSASTPLMKATLSFDEESDEGEEEDDEDNDDLDGPNRIDPVKALNTSLRSPAKPKSEPEPKSQEHDDDEDDNEDDDEDDDEEDDEEDGDEDVEMQDIQSNRSSSRSPVVFNSHATYGKAEPTKPGKSASSTSDESNDENESVDEESSDSEDEASDDVGEDEDKPITGPVHRSPPSLPVTKPTVDISSDGKPSQMSSNAVKSTPVPIPSSSNAARPKSSFASLSSLAKNFVVGPSSLKTNVKSQPLKLAENDDEDNEDESDEESDPNSSSDSDEESELSQSLAKPNESRPPATDSDDSDSDSGSGSDKENEDDEDIARNELSAQIAKMASDSQASTQSYDAPTPKVVKGLQDNQSSGSGKGGKKLNRGSGKEDKYLTKYAFSQPR